MNVFFSKIKNYVLDFSRIYLWLTPIYILLRTFDYFYLTYLWNTNIYDLPLFFQGLGHDYLFLIQSTVVSFPTFYLFSLFSRKFGKIYLYVFCSLLIVLETLLLLFFAEAKRPLDSVIFHYSYIELLFIARSARMNFYVILIIILIPIICFNITTFLKGKYSSVFLFSLFFFFLGTASYASCNRKEFSNIERQISTNKSKYFVSDCLSYLKREKTEYKFISNNVKAFRDFFPEFVFIDHEYPLLHKDNCSDILTPLLNTSEKTPNIVLIIVEGLASENSGPNARFASATPFLDSLASTGLYWHNCIASAPRTVGVLPCIFGALPVGNGGFMSYRDSLMPSFNSLPKILKQNGYTFNFFYGGWMGFDNMYDFLKSNNIDKTNPPTEYKTSSNKNYWGLYDDYLFSEAINLIDFHTENKRLDVYLTLTSHAPISYPNQDSYEKQYLSLDKFKKLNPCTEDIAVYLYVDNAIRKLINDYSHKEGFENTLFIITGDHNCLSDRIEKSDISSAESIFYQYNVPLIIWSPLIKQNKQFQSIVSHREIAPTILTYLKNNFNLQSPNNVTWLNQGLDTNQCFHSHVFLPQMDCSRNISSMIYHDYFMLGDSCYTLHLENDLIRLTLNDNDSIKELFNLYKGIDQYVMKNKKLIPTH